MKLLRKRDGRIEAFSEAKLCAGLERALGPGKEQLELAKELARSVAFFVSRPGLGLQGPGLISSAELSEAVLTALRETANTEAAERYQSYASWRAGAREQVKIEGRPALEVFGEEGLEGWSKGRVADDLTRAGLREEEARQTASGVEERIFSSGLIRVSKDLLRHMINAELRAQGFALQLREERRLGPRIGELMRALERGEARAPRRFEERIAADVLRRFQLDRSLPTEVALAVEHGALALLGLDSPLRAQAFMISGDTELSALPAAVAEARELCFGELLWRPRGEARRLLGRLTPLESSFLRCEFTASVPLRIIGSEGLRSLGFPGLVLERRSRVETKAESLPRSHAWRLPGRAKIRVDVAILNLRRCALLAGRGELEGFLTASERLLRHAVAGLRARVGSFAALVLAPDLPLWRPASAEDLGGRPRGLRDLCAGISVAGLHGALSFLTGESPRESPRVLELAGVVLKRLRDVLEEERAGLSWSIEFLDWPENLGLSEELSQADLLACSEAGLIENTEFDYSLGLSFGLSIEKRARLAELWGVRALWT